MFSLALKYVCVCVCAWESDWVCMYVFICVYDYICRNGGGHENKFLCVFFLIRILLDRIE